MNLSILKEIREATQSCSCGRTPKARIRVQIDAGSIGLGLGAESLRQTFTAEVGALGLDGVDVCFVGERGWNAFEPVVSVVEPGKSTVYYGKVTEELARQIVRSHLQDGAPVQQCRIAFAEEALS